MAGNGCVNGWERFPLYFQVRPERQVELVDQRPGPATGSVRIDRIGTRFSNIVGPTEFWVSTEEAERA